MTGAAAGNGGTDGPTGNAILNEQKCHESEKSADNKIE